jgi:hypothetical protein
LGTRPGSGIRELELFASPSVRRQVEAMGIELMSYGELVQDTRRAAA